ncbi:MAG: hypothetical protein E6Q27_08820 [Aeromicrobium sp.]|nr:MAG: hypothetical protein E6Q27_08820 [Aeromicrobium sp.]
MKRLRERGVPFEIWSTYQHTDILDRAIEFLEAPSPSFVFARGVKGQPIEKALQMVPWLLTCFRSLRRNRKRLRQRLGENPLVIVHGDTVTTVFGALAAKFLKVPSAHIEAGLRSGNLLRPFPEEIDRRIVGMLATTHFAPNAKAVETLRGKDAVNTLRNTAVDGVLDTISDRPAPIEKPYGLVLLHRFEFMQQPGFIKQTLEALDRTTPVPLYILTDVYSGGPITNALKAIGSDKISTIPKLTYPDFVNAMANAELVVTDSGGAQQELGLIGTPTLLHRQVTESPDGIGANILLSKWDLATVEQFMRTYETFRVPLVRPEHLPSEIIIDALVKRGYVSPAPTES